MDEFSDELLTAYLDGELSANEQAQVERALAERSDLRKLLEELRSMGEGLQTLPARRPSPEFTHKMLDRLAEVRREQPIVKRAQVAPAQVTPSQSKGRFSSRRWRISAVLTAAAALLLMAFFSWPFFKPGSDDRSVALDSGEDSRRYFKSQEGGADEKAQTTTLAEIKTPAETQTPAESDSTKLSRDSSAQREGEAANQGGQGRALGGKAPQPRPRQIQPTPQPPRTRSMNRELAEPPVEDAPPSRDTQSLAAQSLEDGRLQSTRGRAVLQSWAAVLPSASTRENRPQLQNRPAAEAADRAGPVTEFDRIVVVTLNQPSLPQEQLRQVFKDNQIDLQMNEQEAGGQQQDRFFTAYPMQLVVNAERSQIEGVLTNLRKQARVETLSAKDAPAAFRRGGAKLDSALTPAAPAAAAPPPAPAGAASKPPSQSFSASDVAPAEKPDSQPAAERKSETEDANRRQLQMKNEKRKSAPPPRYQSRPDSAARSSRFSGEQAPSRRRMRSLGSRGDRGEGKDNTHRLEKALEPSSPSKKLPGADKKFAEEGLAASQTAAPGSTTRQAKKKTLAQTNTLAQDLSKESLTMDALKDADTSQKARPQSQTPAPSGQGNRLHVLLVIQSANSPAPAADEAKPHPAKPSGRK